MGFDGGVVKAARGTDWELSARAEAGHGCVVPKVVHVHIGKGAWAATP